MSLAVLSTMAQKKSMLIEYPSPEGNLLLNVCQISFNNIMNTETKSDTIKIFNDWDKTMTIKITDLPEYLTCKLIPDQQLKPKEKGIIVVSFNAAKRNDFGLVNDRFVISTNDSIRPEKLVTILATIVENFSKLTTAQLKKAAKIKFESTTFKFDTITEGEKVGYDFIFSNIGKSELIIRKTKGSCGCTVPIPAKTKLKPGESSKIHVIFNSAGKFGKQHKTITIISNDPINTTTTLNIEGVIKKKTETGLQQPKN